MATAASNHSPTVVRSQSSSRQPPSAYGPGSPAQLNRARSTNHRSTTSSSHQRSGSRTASQDVPPTPNQNTLASVARRDFEDPNLARPQSSRRSSRDGRAEASSSGTRHVRTSSRPTSRRNSGELTQAPVTNGASSHGQPAPTTAAPPPYASSSAAYQGTGRRRTSITTPTGTWSLGKTIGQGSMGKVKLAKNAETGETAAIKIVPRQTLDDQGNSKDERSDRSKEVRTAREAALVSLLHHPYICKMVDVQKTNYHWYMLFEYVNGGQMLDYIIAHGRLKEKQARKFGRQIASALDYCHRNNVVHRDLKIENILISKTGDIKIIDFGLSNLFSPRGLLKTFCGSLYFAAPELLQARQYTGPEVDVWSFGIVLYVLVCGKVPFDDQSMPQLHAKIKRGVVEYPQWLTAECKSIISRMLVVDPRERATLHEIMNHPWMTKGFNTPPENFLTQREPLQLPLDDKVVEKMQGFDFGSAAYISEQLTQILSSDDYQTAVRRYYRDEPTSAPSGEKKRGVFDFYRRRNSISREGLTTPSTEAIRGLDPINGYSPLISIYYLAQEKLEQERRAPNPGALGISSTAPETSSGPAPLASPEAAYTNAYSPEIPGERATGGRSRPRARTNGEDDGKAAEQPSPATRPPPSAFQSPGETAPKKEGTAMGILRRFSTRRVRNPDDRPSPPTLNVQPPQDSATTPRKSFSVRRSRRRDPSPAAGTHHAGGSQPQHEGLLSAGTSKARSFLGRSTSVNSADYRPRRFLHRGGSEADSPNLNADPPATSGSDHSANSQHKLNKPAEQPTEQAAEQAAEQLADNTPPGAASNQPRVPNAARTKSLGHARQESIQARRRRWEESRKDRHANVPEETDAELRDEAGGPDTPALPDKASTEVARPAGLKGLFSTATTSSKPPEFIRQDLIRVLKQLGVEYTAIRGGFSCRHAPSINLDDVREPTDEEKSGRVLGGHQRRISFGAAFRGKDREDVRDEKGHRHGSSRRRHPDQSFVTNSEGSEEYLQHQRRDDSGRDAGATTTRVQDDTGERLVLRFEVAIVKIPLLSLHGIQFKKVQGGMNQYRSMTGTILHSLRL